MSDEIILDARRLFAYECFYELGDYTGQPKIWLDELWTILINEPILLEEFMYYIDNHTFLNKLVCDNYCLADLYVFQISRYNLIQDIGKNTESCNKEALVLKTFYEMGCMLKNPQEYLKKLSDDSGMDKL